MCAASRPSRVLRPALPRLPRADCKQQPTVHALKLSVGYEHSRLHAVTVARRVGFVCVHSILNAVAVARGHVQPGEYCGADRERLARGIDDAAQDQQPSAHSQRHAQPLPVRERGAGGAPLRERTVS